MTTFWLVVFLLSLTVCVYIYFGYPLLLLLLSRLRPRPVRKGPVEPAVTVIAPAHDEEAVIGEKIRNSLELDYPAERLEVIVAANGCRDRTEEIVRDWERRDRRVRLIALPGPGKAFALNEAARQARGEILVFSDANTVLDGDALRHLVANYADPEVGAVTGNKRAHAGEDADATAEGEGIYWRFEMWQKRLESEIGSCYIGDGALHSVRKPLYVPISDPARGDDVAISTRAVLQGYRLIFEPAAVVRERSTSSSGSEIKRKIRITNRCMRALLGLGGKLWTSGFYSFELLSHKFFRYLIPFFMIALLVSNLFLARAGLHPFFALALAGQILFYALAAAGYLLRGRPLGRKRLFWVPFYFCFVNTGALLGVLTLLRGTRAATWSPRGGLGS